MDAVMAIPHITLGFGSGVAFWESLRHNHDKVLYQEKFEGAKGVTRSHKSKKDRQYNGQNKQETTMIYKIPYRKPKTEQDKSHQILGVNSGAQEGLAVPVPPMSRRSDDHIGIVINTKKTSYFIEGHPRNIPVKFTLKHFIVFRE
jgi:hypothetical protein